MDTLLEQDVSAISRIDAVCNILEVVCRTTGMGFSAVARVTDTHWVACAVRDEIAFGLKAGSELELHTTICDEIRDTGQLVVIDHVAEDTHFRVHHTPKMYGFQSYISVPIIRRNGGFFGTLCAIDPRPAKLNRPEIVNMFKLFAELIAQHLDALERVSVSEAALMNERESAQLREQFIAVLGHDLRNPLAAISSGAQVLRMMPQSEDAMEFIDIIQRSSTRMAELISNVLDFARGRLGGGLTLHLAPDTHIEQVVEQVVTELRTVWPSRLIHDEVSITHAISCDSVRIAQMISNLVANALAHGDPSSPIWVRAKTADHSFELSVTNRGPTIPPEIIERMFRPFARGAVKPGQQGLGLGLYISAEIARAHQGTLTVSSQNGETTFTFHMPANP